MHRSQVGGREADQNIDELLDLRHPAEDLVYDVPVVAHEAAEADEAPVESTDEDQDVGGPREARLRLLIHEKRGSAFRLSKKVAEKTSQLPSIVC